MDIVLFKKCGVRDRLMRKGIEGNTRVCHLKREKSGQKAIKNGEKASKAT